MSGPWQNSVDPTVYTRPELERHWRRQRDSIVLLFKKQDVLVEAILNMIKVLDGPVLGAEFLTCKQMLQGALKEIDNDREYSE